MFAALENANICSVCTTVEMFKADKFIKPLSAESDRGWERSNKHQLFAVSTSLKLTMNWNVTDAELNDKQQKE